MPNVKVTFDRIDVNKDGEATQKGKLYWKFNVNGTKVSERTSSNPLVIGSGTPYDINTSRSFEVADNANLSISGFVAEKDGFTSGKDENAPFERTYDRSENWGDGPHDVRLVDRGLDCNVAYTIEVE